MKSIGNRFERAMRDLSSNMDDLFHKIDWELGDNLFNKMGSELYCKITKEIEYPMGRSTRLISTSIFDFLKEEGCRNNRIIYY